MKRQETALVILDGYQLNKDYLNFFWKKCDLCICVDGSYHWVKEHNLDPDIVIGDLDAFQSIPNSPKTKFIKLEDQNTTDAEKALVYLLENSIFRVKIIGLVGSRVDHLFWNLNLIKKYQKKFQKINCFSPTEKIILTNDKQKKFVLPLGTRISLFPFYGNIKNISSCGLKYEIQEKNLSLAGLVSISNENIQKNVFLSWDKGDLLILIEQEFQTK